MRHDAGGHDVAHEELAVRGQRPHAFLDARAAGVEQADHGDAAFHRQLHDPADLLRLDLREGAAEDREVLGVQRHPAAVDLGEAGHHAVARVALLVHAEVAEMMGRQPAQFLECAGIEQRLDALARRQLAAFVLVVDTGLAAAQLRLGAHVAQFCQFILHV